MRILSVADLHYSLKQWDWLQGAIKDYDLLVIPGDLLDIVSPVALDVQILVVKKYLRRLKDGIAVLVSSGNHDGDHRTESGESVADWLREAAEQGIAVDGDSFERDGFVFTICPWWDGDCTKKEVGQLLERDAAKSKSGWIWLYHAPPAGSPLAWDGKKEFGDVDLLHWIQRYQPDLVFAGHIHHAPFTKDGVWWDKIGKTLIFNAGRQIGPIPTYIEFDLNAGLATWRSLARVETVNLKTGQLIG